MCEIDMRHIEIDNGYPVGDERRIAGKNLTIECNGNGEFRMRCLTEKNEERWLQFHADGTISSSWNPEVHYLPTQSRDTLKKNSAAICIGAAQQHLGLLSDLMLSECKWCFSALGYLLPPYPAFQSSSPGSALPAAQNVIPPLHPTSVTAITQTETLVIKRFASTVMKILQDRYDELFGRGWKHGYRVGPIDANAQNMSYEIYLMSFYEGVRIAACRLLAITRLADISVVQNALLRIMLTFSGGGAPGFSSHSAVMRCEPLFMWTDDSSFSMVAQLNAAARAYNDPSLESMAVAAPPFPLPGHEVQASSIAGHATPPSSPIEFQFLG